MITLGAPVVTFVCYCATLFLWYTRLDGCREVAPHITTLTSIIATAANFGYAWWHLKNLVVVRVQCGSTCGGDAYASAASVRAAVQG